jgi:hypothetical protein
MKKCILALAITIAVGLAGCVEKTAIGISSTVPAAEAGLKTSQDSNGNTVVDLKVKHLAPPQNLQPPMSMYVAWVQTPDGKVFNAGRLTLNNNLEGEVRITTPYPQFRVVISAENDPLASGPSAYRVLETEQIEIQ